MASNNRTQKTASELAERLAIKYTEARRLVRALTREEIAKLLLDARVRAYNWGGGNDPETANKLVEDMIRCGSVAAAGRDADPEAVINLWTRCLSLTLRQKSRLLAKANVPLMVRAVDLVPGDKVNLLPVMTALGVDGPRLAAARAGMAVVNKVEFMMTPDNEPAIGLETDQLGCVLLAFRPVEMQPGKSRCSICGTPRPPAGECPGCEVRKPRYGYREQMWARPAGATAQTTTV